MPMRSLLPFVMFSFVTSAAPATANLLVEIGDAGSLPATAQVAGGTGPLTQIAGSLADESDVDMFAIRIDGGGTFSASTIGLSDVDTRLYLFSATGLGVYGNDDANVFTLQSELPAGDPLTPLTPGLYYLAITSFEIDPISGAGRIFPQPLFPEELLGPTGPGGGAPVSGYIGSGESGSYTIALTGASFIPSDTPVVPEPSTLAMASSAIVPALVVGIRRARSVSKPL